MVADIDSFFKYPWGRKSILLTVESAKARSTAQYVQKEDNGDALVDDDSLSAVVAFVLLELHATNQLSCAKLGDVMVKTAGRCYAVDCLSLE
ncbi:unnamed protein product [Microthlaspi erraticum]|uniref:DUF1985 domain-containing protein n=1 Tax=Microthlaspi erraticum TaxID=1685480 RepID=A0A6D2KZS8_9BRAS|nr:unnamed protein product [Microthlaspi erraticum]